jgi:DNA-binding CsgD family transcriptional regulator
MYKPIKGFSNYAVDENGVVYSYFYNRPLEGRSNKGGYMSYHLKSDIGKRINKLGHRLVAEAFIPNPDNLPIVRHLNNNPSDNRKSNLCWGTYQDNELDKIEHGTYDLRRSGKLSKEDREKIIDMYKNGYRQKELAVMYNVSRPTITRLINGTTWSNFKCAA